MKTIKEIFNTMEYGTAPESAATALDWIGDKGSPSGELGSVGRFSLFIDGKFVTPDGAKMMTVTAPATGETLAQVVDGSAEDVALAFKAAAKAQKKWAKTSDHHGRLVAMEYLPFDAIAKGAWNPIFFVVYAKNIVIVCHNSYSLCIFPTASR